jgi:hypothetical protein
MARLRRRFFAAFAAGAAVLPLAALTSPVHALTAATVACEGTLTSVSRADPFTVQAGGPTTCAAVDGAPVVGTAQVTLTVAESTCELMGAAFSISLGGHTYGFTYLGAGTSGSGAAAQLFSSRDGVPSPLPANPAGWLLWADTTYLSTQVCTGLLDPLPTGVSKIAYALTGEYSNPA